MRVTIMKKSISTTLWLPAVLALALYGCAGMDQGEDRPINVNVRPTTDNQPKRLIITPEAIPGSPKSASHNPSGGYAPSNVQAQLKIDVAEGTRQVRVIRDNTDPYVITKPYVLKNADPYAVRSYLDAAVGAKSVSSSPAQVTAVKYTDGTGVVLVSAEEYRFADSEAGRGIDKIVAALDRKGLNYLPAEDTYVYFPVISRASNLRSMLLRVGSSELDPQFEVSPSTVLVDGELNALIIKASEWNYAEMLKMLKQYDRATPEVKISYRILEIYAENDDRIGVDFQSWKNNEGVDFFSAGTTVSRNWGTFFTSGVQHTKNNRTSYWNFNPKWNSRYLDFMTSIGKAKCLAQGSLVAQNRKTSTIQVNSGFFYDRTYYTPGATSLSEAFQEFTYTEPNPDTILRESMAKMFPVKYLQDIYNELGINSAITEAGYTMRMMGTQTGTNVYYDAIAKATKTRMEAQGQHLPDDYYNSLTSAFSKYFTGYVKADGTPVGADYTNVDWNKHNAAPGVIHGWLQYPMVVEGFQFDLRVTPIVTGNAAQLKFDMKSASLLGWNSDGSARMSNSNSSTTVQIGYGAQDFVIGGLRKSEAVRSTAGLPFLKDLPVIGRLVSTESESIKQSQLVLVAHVEYSNPDSFAGADIRENLGKIANGVNEGMKSRVGNMFFQQYGLDYDRQARKDRLDDIGEKINDEYKEIR